VLLWIRLSRHIVWDERRQDYSPAYRVDRTHDLKALVRGSFLSGYSLPFLLRQEEEFTAAKAFYEQHHPITPFVIRDYRFYPYQEVTVRIASPFREQGSDVSLRFNYSFDVVEVT
jgi:hypothetical protein